jgi:hypothetical protein
MQLRIFKWIRHALSTARSRAKRRVQSVPLPPLPTFRSGGALLDIADRNALHDLFDTEEGWLTSHHPGR